MKHLLLSILLLLGAASTALAAPDQRDLPVNPRTTALTYVYCLTNDRPAVTDLLIQRITYIGETEKNASDIARQWVAQGYCRTFLSDFDQLAPKMRARVSEMLKEAGFTPREPISEQVAAKGGSGKKKLGGLLGKIGRFIGGLLSGGASYERTHSCTETTITGADGSSTTTKTCDKSTTITIGGRGGSGFEPTPFYPDPPK